MIKRIVKLEIHPQKISEFISLFKENKSKISACEGCLSLELMQDLNNEKVFFTYSFWQSEKYLESYRNSAIFHSIWSNAKLLFDDKPLAWSVNEIL